MELNNYGFSKVGEWGLEKNLKSGITFKLDKFMKERAIYAFVMNDETKYIGVCESSNTTLEDRMGRYKSLQGAGTNKRIAEKIRDCLKRERAVKIFALKPDLLLQFKYKDVNIDLVKGLENPLIEKLRPEWNIQK